MSERRHANGARAPQKMDFLLASDLLFAVSVWHNDSRNQVPLRSRSHGPQKEEIFPQ